MFSGAQRVRKKGPRSRREYGGMDERMGTFFVSVGLDWVFQGSVLVCRLNLYRC